MMEWHYYYFSTELSSNKKKQDSVQLTIQIILQFKEDIWFTICEYLTI